VNASLVPLVVAIVLVGCSADLEDTEALTPEADDGDAGPEELAFELPDACSGWRHLAPGEHAKAELHIDFDDGIDDLRATGAGECMRATLAALAADPPLVPLSLHIGSDRRLPLDPSFVEPRLGSTGRESFMRRVRALMLDLGEVAAGCSEEPGDVRMKITVEGPRRTVVSAAVDDPSGHPAEACLVEATLGRELGEMHDDAPRLHAVFPLHVGPPEP
jgi:hypothetical protein